MASLVDILLGRQSPQLDIPSLDGLGSLGQVWKYGNNPVGTETTRPQQFASNATPIDPVVGNGDLPLTRGMLHQMGQNAWQTANSVSDGGLAAPGMMGAIKAYHGSPHTNLTEIATSERGALGPGAYFSPARHTAEQYAGSSGRIYDAEMPENLFHGSGRNWMEQRDANPYQVWRDQVSKVVAAAPEASRAKIAEFAAKLHPEDGYPFFYRLSQTLGGDEAAQAVLKRAGFGGISGIADGPEIAVFGKVPIQNTAGTQ